MQTTAAIFTNDFGFFFQVFEQPSLIPILCRFRTQNPVLHPNNHLWVLARQQQPLDTLLFM